VCRVCQGGVAPSVFFVPLLSDFSHGVVARFSFCYVGALDRRRGVFFVVPSALRGRDGRPHGGW
jgi:hypothetical protein